MLTSDQHRFDHSYTLVDAHIRSSLYFHLYVSVCKCNTMYNIRIHKITLHEIYILEYLIKYYEKWPSLLKLL